MKDKVEHLSLIVTAGISILISFLDLTGLLENIPFLAGRTSALSLLVLGVVVGYLALERRSKLDRIEQLVVEGFESAILSLQGGPVRLLSNSQDVYEYAAQRMGEATESIDDLTWGMVPVTRLTESQQHAFERYYNSRIATASRKHIRYREVMSFPSEARSGIERLEWAEEMAEKNIFGYQLRYYDFSHRDVPPLLQFLLIDSEEVIFAFYRGMNLPLEGEVHLAVKHPRIVSLFQDYYDSIWQGAKVLKEAGEPMAAKELQRIRKHLSTERRD